MSLQTYTPTTNSFHLDCFQGTCAISCFDKQEELNQIPPILHKRTVHIKNTVQPKCVVEIEDLLKVDNPDNETQPLDIIFNYPNCFFVMNIRPQFQCRCSAQISIKSGITL